MMGAKRARAAYHKVAEAKNEAVTILRRGESRGRLTATAKATWEPVATLVGQLFRRRENNNVRGPGGERAAHEYVFKFSSPFQDSVLPLFALREMRLVCGRFSVAGEWDEDDEYAIGKPEVGEDIGDWQTICLPLQRPARGNQKPAGVAGA